MNVFPTGILAADGSKASNAMLGAGSGGSVIISAYQCVVDGEISATGGEAFFATANSGAAGGGGRISIIVSYCFVLCHSDTSSILFFILFFIFSFFIYHLSGVFNEFHFGKLFTQ